MKRIVQPELLDALPPADPRALRSRRDLRRLNSWMRHHSIMAESLGQNLKSHTPEIITELGAGDGHFLLLVAKELSARWPNANVILLDRQENVAAETFTAFSELGWRAEAIVADVFDQPPTSGKIFMANLFLHHFTEAQLAELFCTIASRALLFVAIEPRRARLPLFFSRLLWAIGCNEVTRHDATISVRAGFSRQELSLLWPDKLNWQLSEHRAGWFSHLFIAKKNC